MHRRLDGPAAAVLPDTMPKSKRNKVVALTKVKKKGREWKEGVVEKVRDAVEKYPSVYLFRHYNMRTEKFKELREEMKAHSKFILGSNAILQVALGRSPSDELRTNLHLLSEKIKGQVGLLFTSLPSDEVTRIIDEFEHEDYARAGAKATHDFRIKEGPVPDGAHGPLQHTMEPQLRKYGMPTKLNKGVIEVLSDFVVCKEGKVLDANQAAILKVFDEKMAVFSLKLLGVWRADDEEYEELADDDGDEDMEGFTITEVEVSTP